MISAIATMLLLDFAWIGSSKSMYAAMVQDIQGAPMVVRRTWAAALAYALMAVGLVKFVMPMQSWKGAFIFGVVLYGVFNATNLALFDRYDPRVALVDTLWGGTVMTLTYLLSRA
jgi:uncharacterized membrane protein